MAALLSSIPQVAYHQRLARRSQGCQHVAALTRGSLLGIQRLNPDVSEAQVGGRVVALDAQTTFPFFEPVASVVALLAVVGPVDDLVAVDPGGEVPAVGGDGHREPL